jgi:hypothetical protein
MSRRIAGVFALPFLLAGCESPPESHAATPAPPGLTLVMNFDGAKALLSALDRRTITPSAIDSLFAIRGVAAMVDNTTHYLPDQTRDTFRAALTEFVTKRKSTIGHFALDDSYDKSGEIRTLIAKLEADSTLTNQVAGPLARYMPKLPAFSATVYGTTGGVSDGFVTADDPRPAFYMALNRAQGDVQGVRLNMTHELYHVVQRMAWPTPADSLPPLERLLRVILEEGTATYVAQPPAQKSSFFRRSGPYLEVWRASSEKNSSTRQIAANFAEVDRLIAGLRAGTTTWEQAQNTVFRGYGPGPYFVGYEMAKAIDQHDGPERIASLLQKHPAEFFRTYIEIYRKNPGAAPAKFSAATEAYIDSIPSR